MHHGTGSVPRDHAGLPHLIWAPVISIWNSGSAIGAHMIEHIAVPLAAIASRAHPQVDAEGAIGTVGHGRQAGVG